MIKRLIQILFLAAAAAAAAVPAGPIQAQAQTQIQAQAPAEMWPEAVLYPGRADLVLVVDKANQELRIYRPGADGSLRLEKVIPCSTGMIQGDKLIRGDKKTPEGYYIFRQKLLPEEMPDIYGILAYPMDYPNFWDQKIGRGGDGIWTHGINKPLVDYDSNGCIELLNHDLAALEDSIRLYDTPIVVAHELKLAPAEDQQREARDVLAFVESWRRAWAEKNLPLYRRHYDPQFVNSENRSLEGWMDQKKHVSSLYSQIKVELEDIRIFRHRDVIAVSFIQKYQGDRRFQSAGLKRLYLRKTAQGYAIAGEEFANLPGRPAAKRLSASQKQAALTDPPVAVASLTAPVAVASAGALAPRAPDAPFQEPSGADAAYEESARAALEKGTYILTPPARPAPAAAETSPPALSSPVLSPAAPAPSALSPPSLSPADLSPAAPSPLRPPAAPPAEPAQSAGSRSPGPAASGSPAEPAGPPEPAVRPPAPLPAGSLADAGIRPLTPPPERTASPDRPSAETDGASGSSRTSRTQLAPAGRTPEPGPQAGSAPAAALRGPAAGAAPPSAGLAGEPGEVQLRIVVAGWLAAWNARDEEGYFSFYAPDFYFPEKNIHLAAFKRYRSRMMNKTRRLKVSAENVRIQAAGRQGRAVFIQRYESDQTRDRGEKTLEFRLQDGQWHITRENWEARP